MALPQLQPFVAEHGEQVMRNVVYALEAINFLAKNGKTNAAFYATTRRGGQFAQELLDKRGVTKDQFWASLA